MRERIGRVDFDILALHVTERHHPPHCFAGPQTIERVERSGKSLRKSPAGCFGEVHVEFLRNTRHSSRCCFGRRRPGAHALPIKQGYPPPSQQGIGVQPDARVLASLPAFILETWVIRFKTRPTRATQFKIPGRSGIALTWLWLKMRCFFGSDA